MLWLNSGFCHDTVVRNDSPALDTSPLCLRPTTFTSSVLGPGCIQTKHGFMYRRHICNGFFNHGHGCGDFLCNAVDKLLSHFTFFTRGWNYSFVIGICPLVSVTNEKNIFLIYSFVF